jgi:UDP-GlcNAc:undecaprenyl-phosphate/decaprenyl-phosphate GlcNAc-1-phosphate transferase
MTTTLVPLVCACVAGLLTLALTPLAARLAHAAGAVDVPTDRRIHLVATPRLGGLAILVAFLVPTLYYLPDDAQTRGLVAGAGLVALLGVVDDVWGLAPAMKGIGQLACAAVPVSAGLTIDHVTLPLLGYQELGPAQYPLTLLWFVALVNMINFTDGMDGLAAGVSGIGLTTFAVIAASLDRADPAIIAASLAGACIAFLVFNFHPARVFMGDSGSMLLGTLLSGATITGIGRTTQPQAADQFALLIPVAIPILVLALPFIDTLFAVGRRMRAGRGIMTADKNHLHHRLLEMGHSHRKAVLILYAWSALLAGSAVALSFIGATRVLPYFLAVVIAGIIGLLAPRWRASRQGRI